MAARRCPGASLPAWRGSLTKNVSNPSASCVTATWIDGRQSRCEPLEGTTTMRAYVLDRYGGPEGSSLTDVPAPTPGRKDILVEVRAAGLNPVDFKFRQGKLRAIHRPKLPFVLGNEFAGEVIGVGDDVKQFRVDDRVFARVAKERAGAFAEQACVDEDHVAHMPRDLDFTAARAFRWR